MKKLIASFFLFIVFENCDSQSGAALNFDGVNDFVTLSNINTPFNISSAHIKSVQFWFKNPSNQGQHVRIFSTGSANWTSGFWLGFQAGSPTLMLELSDGIGGGKVITATTSTRGDNIWHHATAVFNGSLATLYLDGTIQGTVNISSEAAMPSSGSVHIGNSYNNESSSNFQGAVDEIRIWDRVLCQYEIMNTKDCELSGAETGLVAYYNFNQATAAGNNAGLNILTDLTVSANNGTLTNFALSGSTSNWVAPGAVVSGVICPNTNTGFLTTSSPSVICTGKSSILTVNGASNYTWQPGNLSGSQVTVSPSSSSIYSVTGSDASKCITTSTILITVVPAPVINISTNKNMLCRGASCILTAAGANTYTWNTGSNNSVVTISPQVTTIFTVNATALNNCTNSAVFTQSVSECNDLKQNSNLSLNVHFYPNPFTEIFTIKCDLNMSCVLEIYNVMGALVHSQNLPNSGANINLKDQNAGIYFLRVISEGNETRSKLIKQ